MKIFIALAIILIVGSAATTYSHTGKAIYDSTNSLTKNLYIGNSYAIGSVAANDVLEFTVSFANPTGANPETYTPVLSDSTWQ